MFTSRGKLGRRGRGCAVGGSSQRFFSDSLEWTGFPLPSAREYDDDEWFDRVTHRAMDGTLPLHSLDIFEDVIAPLVLSPRNDTRADESDGSSHSVASGGLPGADLLPVSATRDFPAQMAAARGLDQGVLIHMPLPKEPFSIDEHSDDKTGVPLMAAPSAELNGGRIQVRRNRGKVPIGATQALQRECVDNHTLSADSPTVLVWNLPFALSAANLWALVQDSGAQVVDCRIVENSEGKSRGFAHVDLADANSVRIAMERVSGMVVGGRVVHVDYLKPSIKAGKQSVAKRTHSGEFGQRRKESSALSMVHSMDVRSLSDPLPIAHNFACYRHSDEVRIREFETRRRYDCGSEVHRSGAYQMVAVPLSATTVRPLRRGYQ